MLNWRQNDHHEAFLYEVNRDHFAAREAQQVFVRHFGSWLFEDDRLYVVVGTDSGLLPRYVSAQLTAGSKSRYLFVEHDEVLAELQGREPLLDARVAICSLADLDRCRDEAGFASFCFRDRVFHRIVDSIGAADDYAGLYADLRRDIALSHAKAIQLLQVGAGRQVFMERQILNAADHLRSVVEIYPRIAGRSVLVLAGGPSLDQHLPWIAEHRDAFVVIAIARIGAALAAHGIRPDFYAVVDPQPGMFDVARDALANSGGIPLLSSYHANPGVVANWGDEVFFDGCRLPWQWAGNEALVPTAGPTVTHFALSVALHARAHEVYLAGMDLCYGVAGMQSHTAHSAEAKTGPVLGVIGARQVRTYAGEMADADIHLLMGADTAASWAQFGREHGIGVFNLSQSAAAVRGIEYLDRSRIDIDAARRMCSQPPAIEALAPAAVLESVRSVRAELDACRTTLRKLHRDLRARERKIGELFDARGTIRPKISRQVGAIDRVVDQDGRNLSSFLKSWGTGRFLNVLLVDKAPEDIGADDLKAFYRTYYDAYLKSIAEVEAVIGRALETCDRRLREWSGGNLAELVEQWTSAEELLRVEKPALQQVLAATPGFAETQAQMRSRYQEMHLRLARAHEERCRQRVTRRNVLAAAYHQYDYKREAALSHLVAFVRESDNAELQQGLHALLQGLSHELEGRADEALSQYDVVLNEGDQYLVELALRRILHIAKARDDFELSLQALEVLEQLSANYLKYHAEVLLLLGEVGQALDKLADYHTFFPDDVDNMARIIEIYHNTGNVAQAQSVLAELIKLHPEHRATQRVKQLVYG